MSTTSVADPPKMAQPATSPPPDPKVRCEHLIREARVEARALLAEANQQIASGVRERRERRINEMMQLAGRWDDSRDVAERIRLNDQMIEIAKAELAERHARSDRLIEDLLAPKPAEADTSETPDMTHRQRAEQLIQQKVDSGELVRLTGGRIIETTEYDPAVHGERLTPEAGQ